jgi:hypothetical protein
MDDVKDAITGPPVAADTTHAETESSDRRRPGRIRAMPAALVPLLRRQTLLLDTAAAPAEGHAGDAADDAANDAANDSDSTRMFVGIVVGALMATPFWVLLGIIIWWALR